MIELCQVSDIRAGGLPKVKMSFPLSNANDMRQKKKKERNCSISGFLEIYLTSATACNKNDALVVRTFAFHFKGLQVF